MLKVSATGLGKLPTKMYHLHQFDSMAELVRHADATTDKQMSAHQGTRNGFFKTESWEEARDLALSGWHDVRPQVEGKLSVLRQKLGSTLAETVTPVWDFVGSRPDIDRYLDGEMECMIEDYVDMQPKNGNVFTLLVSVGIADTPRNAADLVLERGAAVIALVEAYAMLGYQLEIWAERTVTHKCDEFLTILTRVAAAGDPLDIDNVMFAIGHPDMNRRVCFAVGEGDRTIRSKFQHHNQGNYGWQSGYAHMAARVGASSVITLDGNTDMNDDPVGWILGQLATQGVYENE